MMLLVLCVMVDASVVAEEVQPVQSGAYDDTLISMLRDATAVLNINETTLAEIAPELIVDGPSDATWDEAVRFADEHLAHDKARRAVYLRRFLSVGDPAMRLASLGLAPLGATIGQGELRSIILPLPQNDARDWMNPAMFLDVVVTSRKPHTIARPATLCIRHRRIGSGSWSLVFDQHNRLVDFTGYLTRGDDFRRPRRMERSESTVSITVRPVHIEDLVEYRALITTGMHHESVVVDHRLNIIHRHLHRPGLWLTR
jgi:hypothetical protein